MSVELKPVSDEVKELEDALKRKRELDRLKEHGKTKNIISVKIQYEDGSFETIYKVYESNFEGIQEGE